jgi:hypothetical protein
MQFIGGGGRSDEMPATGSKASATDTTLHEAELSDDDIPF